MIRQKQQKLIAITFRNFIEKPVFTCCLVQDNQLLFDYQNYGSLVDYIQDIVEENQNLIHPDSNYYSNNYQISSIIVAKNFSIDSIKNNWESDSADYLEQDAIVAQIIFESGDLKIFGRDYKDFIRERSLLFVFQKKY